MVTLRILNKVKLGVVFGPHLDLETINSFKRSFSIFGILSSYSPYHDYSSSYFSPIRVKDIETYSTFLSINSYLRNEIPLLNTRVRKSNNFYMSSFKFFGVGVGYSYFTYPIKLISNNTSSLYRVLNGKSYISKLLSSSERGLVVFHKFMSSHFFTKTFKLTLKPLLIKIDNSVSTLISAHLGLVDSNFVSASSPVYSVGFDTNLNYSPLVYQGHHGNSSMSTSLVVMPSTVFSEKNSNFLNLEGIMQKSHTAVSADLLVRKDEEIFKALIEFSLLLDVGINYSAFKKFYSFISLEPTFSFNLPN